MSLPEIRYCPGSLAEGFSTYSPSVMRRMFGGHRVSHILDMDPPSINPTIAQRFRENARFMSMSGVQAKQSMILDRNKLRLTEPHERGQFILKPIPDHRRYERLRDLPANEHLTMQIARQVYKIECAECVVVFFKNGEPAYLTRRFDSAPNGAPLAQEDFASILGRSRQLQGEEFKYLGSYLEIAEGIRRHVPAHRIDLERFFTLVMFNHLFHNQDAHLKNFTLRQTLDGDYRLSPAYDLLHTEMHVTSGVYFALDDGLYDDYHEHPSFRVLGFPGYDDFHAFGEKLGLPLRRIHALMEPICTYQPEVKRLVSSSFLSEEAKAIYLDDYHKRLKGFNQSMAGRR